MKKKDKKKQITTANCNFLLITGLPNGKSYQVLINQEFLRMMVNQYGEFKVLEEPVEGLTFEIKKQ